MSRPLPVHEEHGEVVATWRALGYERETVVCFDRHIDLKPLDDAAILQLRDARGVEALRRLNRALPFREAPGAFGLDDFFAAGPVLGTVHALWWVMPGVWPSGRVRVRAAIDAIARISAEPDTLAQTHVVDGVLQTRLCGLDLHVHTIETLRARGVPEHARIDIDLDWLADGDAPPQHTTGELVALLRALGCIDRIDSLTWSVRSGFLAHSMRDTASQIANAVGRALEPVAWDDARPIPERTLVALRGEAGAGPPKDLPEDLAAELEPLGAVGVALSGCLAVRAGAIERAEAAWHEASEAGVRSSWLAHGIGIAWYDQDPRRALTWLERAGGRGLDTLEIHAATLALLCLIRLGQTAEARVRVRALVDRQPLNRKLLRIGALVAGDPDERARLVAREHLIDALISRGDA